MQWNEHSKLAGKHAAFTASQPSWLNKTYDQMVATLNNSYATTIGTALHDIARKHIEHRIKLTKASKNEVLLSLLADYKIPQDAVNLSLYFENLCNYVNDAIGYRLSPEVVLYYSDYFFGTADAIDFKDNKLRIHDLKTGRTPVHMEQLEIYAALFCLEYGLRPGNIEMELRIYKDGDIIVHEPTAEDIVPIIDKMQHFTKLYDQSVK